MTRLKLPDRRENVAVAVSWNTHKFSVSVGFEHGVRDPVEVFYDSGMKEGAELRSMAQDSCVLVSMLLQHGETPASIGKSLLINPEHDGPRPASIVGAIVNAVDDAL